MDTKTKYLKTASEALHIPMEAIKDAWSFGKEIHIVANTLLGHSYAYPNHGIFVSSGILREYFIDQKGNEHTVRFVQGPIFIAPGLNRDDYEDKTELICQTLTTVEGRKWGLDFMLNQSIQNPLFIRSAIANLSEAVYIKAKNDLRLQVCSATERYLLFVEDFPDVINNVPLKYVASYLNMSPETISRVRSELNR